MDLHLGQAQEYAEMFYRTAKAIREVQPEARVYCTAIDMKKEKRADPRDAAKRELTCASFERFERPLRLFWYSNVRPSNRLEFDRVTLRVPGRLDSPVWVDMITGRVGEIDAKNVKEEGSETVLTDVPIWDSPVLIASRMSVPLSEARQVIQAP